MRAVLMTIFLSAMLMTSCSRGSQDSGDRLYGIYWELVYLSGPRIAFEALFPEKKPHIQFDESTGKAFGNSGCNGYSAEFTVKGSQISFGEPGPSTLMYCGEGEDFFRSTIAKVNAYEFDAEGRLNLLIDDVPMMRFEESRE